MTITSTRKAAQVLGFAFVLVGLVLAAVSPPETLDAKLYYSSQEMVDLFARLTPAQTEAYRITAYVDLIFIFVYTLLLATLMPRYRWAAALPGCFDLFETVSILGYLSGGNATVPWLGTVTLLKWVAGFGLTAYVGVGLWNSRNRPGFKPSL